MTRSGTASIASSGRRSTKIGSRFLIASLRRCRRRSMDLIAKLDRRIKQLSQEPLGFRPALDDEHKLLVEIKKELMLRQRQIDAVHAHDSNLLDNLNGWKPWM